MQFLHAEAAPLAEEPAGVERLRALSQLQD